MRRFEEAGFGDVFYAPDHHEWTALQQGKVPNLEAPITTKPSLDTLYSLLSPMRTLRNIRKTWIGK
ncbi:MAG: hypothetical protein R3B74_06870 [Nitrospirales bacterium]|nr:hypothetical protein [Nitrospirales bacterium]